MMLGIVASSFVILAAGSAASATQAGAADSDVNIVSGKAEAIIGGPSKLEAIVAAQAGRQSAAQSAPVNPAGYGTPFIQKMMSNRPHAAIRGQPDVFGSVALPIRRSPFDRRWQKATSAELSGAPASYAASLVGLGDIEKLEAVNIYVNSRVRFARDSELYGTADRWTPANETLASGRGDCEDYAIAKLQMLRRAGFPERDLYLVVLNDTARRQVHAVLAARTDNRFLVLDNATDRLFDSHEFRDYRPIVTFSGNRSWTHGYRRQRSIETNAQNERLVHSTTTLP